MKSIKIYALALGLLAVFAGCQNDVVKPWKTTRKHRRRYVMLLIQRCPVRYFLPIPCLRIRTCFMWRRVIRTRQERIRIQGFLLHQYIACRGFGDTDTYSLDVYAVDRSENYSEPAVNIQVAADTPPVQVAYETLEVQPDFRRNDFLI